MRCISSLVVAPPVAEGVAGVPQIMEADAIEAGRCEGTEPDPSEVVPPQDTTPGAEEDKPGSAGTGVLGQMEREQAHELMAMTYQGAAMVLTKLGETDLAWIAADRGLAAAQQSGNAVMTGSLFRSVAHCLLSNGRFDAATQLIGDAGEYLRPGLGDASPEFLSIYGTLFLTGSMAAARAEDRATTQTFLAEADRAAQRLGTDANHVWTAFGPTNVAIHRVATAAELGDMQIAADLGPQIDTSSLPTERRTRHNLEVARALSAHNRMDDALAKVLEAESWAPEQVRSHYLARELVLTWVRNQRGRPSRDLADLAKRLHVV
ncbi:XRE family transcriptional regulator [Streptomyces sp. NPDC001222]|uniref:XRE family transcriptional regulator n=1 Tax=Streptomyces sp. NPDC001222 TaxID=3364548 RepID=UPI0036A8BEBD